MMCFRQHYIIASSVIIISLALSDCGLYVPEKDLTRDDRSSPIGRVVSERGAYESTMIDHIQCEIAQGLVEADSRFQLPWLRKWGTSVTLTFAVQEQGGVNPTFSFGGPLENAINSFSRGGNVVTSQSYSTGVGIGFLGSTLRSETIQFTYRNADLLKRYNEKTNCDSYRSGVQIDSDLKIRQFIFDKIAIARNGNANLASPLPAGSWALYNALTEELYFNTSASANINPSWKFATATVGQSGSLLAAARTYSNDLIITLGPTRGEPGPFNPVQLDPSAQSQHNAKVTASAISTSLR